MPETHHLSFSIGPVQAFVSQARRTRDLWAGSWLLSYLAESALIAVENEFGAADAKTILPDRSVTRGQLTSIDNPTGGIPNRFEIAFNSRADAVAGGHIAANSFHKAWQAVADAVRQLIDSAFAQGNHSEQIWNRQVKDFWEVNWIVAQPQAGLQPTIGEIAAARKLFRNAKVNEEAGVKCSLMPELQELSGYNRSKDQCAFWKTLKSRSNIGELDLRDGERLSAIALIKRLFPKVDQQLFGKSLKQKNWPSTAFLAASPWLKEIAHGQSVPALAAAREYVNAAQSAGIRVSEIEAARDAGIPWAKLDGPAWFAGAIRNNEWGIKVEQQTPLLQRLRDLYRLAGNQSPTPYYALLLMDGDSMGQLLSALGGEPTRLSQCLGRFTAGVDSVVASPTFGGRTIYAGGDDVMAMLPAIHALAAAAELEQNYRQAFTEDLPNHCGAATLSAAIVYAHWKQPLRQVLELAHYLLDDVAKSQTGRDSLAIGIMKGSGLNAQWSAPWKFIRDQRMLDQNDSVIHQFASREKAELAHGATRPSFNASFLYHLRQQYSRLVDSALDDPGSFVRFSGSNAEDDLFLSLAHAEYRRRLSRQEQIELDPSATRAQITPLMELSRNVVRRNGEPDVDRATFGFDGWRVARFLKQIHDGEARDDD